jgi:hypothetical protein
MSSFCQLCAYDSGREVSSRNPRRSRRYTRDDREDRGRDRCFDDGERKDPTYEKEEYLKLSAVFEPGHNKGLWL